MKEWKTTVWDYVREVKVAHGNLLKNVLFIVIVLAVFFAGFQVVYEIRERIEEAKFEKYFALNTAVYEEFSVHYDDMISCMEARDYMGAADAAYLAVCILNQFYIPENYDSRLDQGTLALRSLEEKIPYIIQEMTWAGQSREAIELLRDRFYHIANQDYCYYSLPMGVSVYSLPMDVPVRNAYITYSQELIGSGSYREAVELLFELQDLFGISAPCDRAAQLYAEELRAAGDEEGAEVWLEYVEERRRGAE